VKVPNGNSAHVDPAKIRDYLLSSAHPIGRFKSVFFRSLGYSADAWYLLEASLRSHIRDLDVLRTQRNPYGTKYVVSGTLVGPSGAAAEVITVWIVLDGEDAPRFVTAYRGED
jgi:hypothetical protein